jgi:hypothetical protein
MYVNRQITPYVKFIFHFVPVISCSSLNTQFWKWLKHILCDFKCLDWEHMQYGIFWMCNLFRKVWKKTPGVQVTLKCETGDYRNKIIFIYEDCYCYVRSDIKINLKYYLKTSMCNLRNSEASCTDDKYPDTANGNTW